MIFSYLKNELRLVQNVTIGLYYEVRKPNEYLAWIVAILAVVAAFVAWLALARR